ncbi:hypothetical protein [Brevundimonas sp. TWP2-3-4b1]|uniref:hypothetical protein n=1 Tax=Brevundimonas sp. TWP2-3-4b1 TaxID=2804580 RepID=UPI003CE997E8
MKLLYRYSKTSLAWLGLAALLMIAFLMALLFAGASQWKSVQPLAIVAFGVGWYARTRRIAFEPDHGRIPLGYRSAYLVRNTAAMLVGVAAFLGIFIVALLIKELPLRPLIGGSLTMLALTAWAIVIATNEAYLGRLATT